MQFRCSSKCPGHILFRAKETMWDDRQALVRCQGSDTTGFLREDCIKYESKLTTREHFGSYAVSLHAFYVVKTGRCARVAIQFLVRAVVAPYLSCVVYVLQYRLLTYVCADGSRLLRTRNIAGIVTVGNGKVYGSAHAHTHNSGGVQATCRYGDLIVHVAEGNSSGSGSTSGDTGYV